MLCATPAPVTAACASSSKMARAVLKFADDGQGFSTMEGNGLRGMRERVEMLGGTLGAPQQIRHHAHHHAASERNLRAKDAVREKMIEPNPGPQLEPSR